MMAASSVGKPILAIRWNCSLFKGTLANELWVICLFYGIHIMIYGGSLIVKGKLVLSQGHSILDLDLGFALYR